MAQFLKARFLSEALKWKANPRHTTDQYFAGLRYDPYIYAQARLSFPEYNKRFPAPANKEFTENFAKDLVNPTRNQELLKIINPVVLTPELEATNSQFEVSARLEQQSVAQATGQPTTQPFSLTAERMPAIPRVPTLPKAVFPQPIRTAAPAPTQVTPVTGAPPTTPPQPQPKVNRPPIQVPRLPPSFVNTARNLGSGAGVFFQRNVGKHLTGDRVMNFLGKAGNAGISALSGISNFGGGRGNIFSSLGGSRITGARGGGIFGRIGGFGRGGGGGGSLIGKTKGRRGLVFAAGLIGFMMLTGALAIIGTTPTGETPPNQPNSLLDYTLPLRDTSVAPQDIKSSILSSWPNAKIDNWQTIIDQAIAHGWNPAVLLAIWIEESGAQGATSYSDPLGCGVGTPTQDIQVSLNCFFNAFDNKFTNDQFYQFMLTYSAPNDPYPFKSNPNFPGRFKDWYSKLVPSGPGAITPVTPTSTPAPTLCTNGDYQACLLSNYKIDFQAGSPSSLLQMAYEALSSTEAIAPKFKNLIHDSCPTITVVPTAGISHISGCTMNLRTTIGRVTFIHELSHIIHNSNPGYYESIIAQARNLDLSYWEGGFLTYYSKYASRPTDFSTICYSSSTGESYLLDEEFAESVTYFINSNNSEINMGTGCSTKWGDNPYQGGNRYTGHYNLMSGILK